MDDLNITYMDPCALKARATNPRTHSKAQVRQIADSITAFGFANPVLVDGAGEIIAGHGRVEAARLLGLERVPTITLADLSPSQIRAYVIADNKLAENGEWDTNEYFNQLKEMSNDGYDLTLMGVDIDMSAFNFNPVYEPSFDASEIDESKMIKADQSMQSDQSSRLQPQQTTDVICPHCGEEFTFGGR